MTSIIFADSYGVIASSNPSDAAINNAAVQNAIDACAPLPGSGGSPILQFPSGRIQVSRLFTANFGLIVRGCGAGQNRVYDPDAPDPINVGGTVIVQNNTTTCDTFLFTTTNSVQVTDLGIDAPLGSTAGSLIHIRAAVTVPDNVRVRNWHSILSNLDLVGGWNQVTLENANAYTVRDNSFRSPTNDGLVATNPATAPTYEAGDAQIYGNKFWVLLDHLGANIFPFGGNAITLAPQSGMQIFSNKMLCCKTAVEIVAAPSGGGVVQVFENNMEELKLYGIHVSQGGGTAAFGGLRASHNHIIGGSTGTFAIGIYIAAGTAGYTYENTIHKNHITVASGVYNAHCIYVADGAATKISGNDCRLVNSAGNFPAGITVTGNATQCELLDNSITGVVAPARRYTLTTPTLVRDITGMTIADFAFNLPNVKGGSTIFFTDGHATSWPTNLALTAGGGGCVATVNTAGAFQCAAP